MRLEVVLWLPGSPAAHDVCGGQEPRRQAETTLRSLQQDRGETPPRKTCPPLARPEIAGCSRPEERIRQLYRIVYGRPATPDEVTLAFPFIDPPTGSSPPMGGGQALTAWERYAQVLLFANEFAFVD